MFMKLVSGKNTRTKTIQSPVDVTLYMTHKELFVFDFSGENSSLKNHINSIYGVESVSFKTSNEIVNREIECEIKYDGVFD